MVLKSSSLHPFPKTFSDVVSGCLMWLPSLLWPSSYFRVYTYIYLDAELAGVLYWEAGVRLLYTV